MMPACLCLPASILRLPHESHACFLHHFTNRQGAGQAQARSTQFVWWLPPSSDMAESSSNNKDNDTEDKKNAPLPEVNSLASTRNIVIGLCILGAVAGQVLVARRNAQVCNSIYVGLVWGIVRCVVTWGRWGMCDPYLILLWLGKVVKWVCMSDHLSPMFVPFYMVNMIYSIWKILPRERESSSKSHQSGRAMMMIGFDWRKAGT